MKSRSFATSGRRQWLRLATLPVAGLLASPVWSQESADAWPSKIIRIVVPFAVGGGTDILGRQVASAIEPLLGQRVIVENRPGAGGGIGTQAVARADPDGYTMVLGTTATHAMNQFLYGKLPYDPEKDFTPVTILIRVDNVLSVPADSPFKTLNDILQAARNAPGKLSYGIVAIGSSAHLASEKLKADAGIQAVGVPYNSQVSGMNDLIAGRLDFMFDSVGNTMPHIRSGKLRPIATSTKTRSQFLPDVPTISESGVPNFEAPGWVGLFVPANTPTPIVKKIAATVQKAYQGSKGLDALKSGGLDLVTSSSPEEYAEFVRAERVKWGKVIREANIKLD